MYAGLQYSVRGFSVHNDSTGTGYILTSLLFVLQAGIYWVNLIDHFCAGWGILIAAVLEIIGIIYIYGKLLVLKTLN